MKRAGMAMHSVSSFNESDAIRKLANVLESEKKIKTFFKENDRTPNYDGSFELINQDCTPKKQFIVQIKKVENLTPNIRGANKGKYVYSLETAFLYYVKEKVTESPAIYFVVDISNDNIFWIYLSDEFLMNLDFEGKYEVSYAFTESDKLKDVKEFTKVLNKISAKRNALFLDKTPFQIAEMQDALDYINSLMNNDLSKIKETMFPNLWRFGIRHTSSSRVSIIVGDEQITPKNTGLFSLYPQIKGIADTGLSEYVINEENFFEHYDFTGKIKPIEYSKQTVSKIVKSFFKQGIPMKYLPDIVVMEMLQQSALEFIDFYEVKQENGKVLLKDLWKIFMLSVQYIHHVLNDDSVDLCEIKLKKYIISRYAQGHRNYCKIIDMCNSFDCTYNLKLYCKKNIDNQVQFSPNIFKLLSSKDLKTFLLIEQLRCRNVTFFHKVWDYNWFELIKLNECEFMDKVNNICQEWFSNLPELYNQTFDTLFENNKYRIKGRFEFNNEYCKDELNGLGRFFFSSVINEYENKEFSIMYNPKVQKEFSEIDTNNELLFIRKGFTIEQFIQRKQLFHNSINCLLYKGVCTALGFKYESLDFDSKGHGLKLF